MSKHRLDDFDRKLVDILSQDARVSNRKIAASLGVTEGMVRARIRKLQDDGLITFTAITNLDSGQLVFINIEAEADKLDTIAEQVSAIPAINAVLVTMGPFNLLAISLFENLEEAIGLATGGILAMDGVYRVETSTAVRTFKYNSGIAKLTPQTGSEEK